MPLDLKLDFDPYCNSASLNDNLRNLEGSLSWLFLLLKLRRETVDLKNSRRHARWQHFVALSLSNIVSRRSWLAAVTGSQGCKLHIANAFKQLRKVKVIILCNGRQMIELFYLFKQFVKGVKLGNPCLPGNSHADVSVFARGRPRQGGPDVYRATCRQIPCKGIK